MATSDERHEGVGESREEEKPEAEQTGIREQEGEHREADIIDVWPRPTRIEPLDEWDRSPGKYRNG